MVFSEEERKKFNIPMDTSDEEKEQKSGSYQITRVKNIHREVIRLCVLGHKDSEIAQIIGISRRHVHHIKNSDIVQSYLHKLHAERDQATVDMSRTIRELSPLALEVSTAIMVDEDEKSDIRARIAKDLLDRAGYKPANVNLNHSERMSRSQIEEVKARARAAGMRILSEEEVSEAEEAEVVEEEAEQQSGVEQKVQWPQDRDSEPYKPEPAPNKPEPKRLMGFKLAPSKEEDGTHKE